MKKNYSLITLFLVPVLASCDFVNNATKHKVSFKEYHEKALLVDTNHDYTKVVIKGYSPTVEELNETYLYDTVLKTWISDVDNVSFVGIDYIKDVASDAQSIDQQYDSSFISKITFKIGLTEYFEYSYKSKDKTKEFKSIFNDKYGLRTYYYNKEEKSTTRLEFTYLKD